MPLTTSDDALREDDRIGVGFEMRDGEQRVSVWVDKGALLILSDKSPGQGDRDLVARYRERLTAIASANYDAGIVESDGSTIIRRDDVEELA